MNNYRRPSLKAVSTFEAAARHESFKGAAEELFLTPSAISHQVRQLEEHLGVNLFHRLSGGLAITDAGAAYLRMLSPAFAGIDDATRQVMELEYSDQLTIRTPPGFAKRWLLDRLPDFLKACPDVDVKVIATSEVLDFRKKNIDIGIYYGRSIWPGHVVRPLLSERVLPMCSPAFKKQAGKLRRPADLLKFTLIHTERNLVTWKMWFADRDVSALEDLRGVCLDPSELAIDAAVRNIGIVLESDMLAAQELEKGALVPAIENSESEIVSYYLVYPEEYEGLPKVAAFSDWITSLANADLLK
ncbi:MAG: LysR family transcriptional regulator [Proteobacteria bacterium]|nr:LysR family transcriptional regulator [Pseudomonadota bacterium]